MHSVKSSTQIAILCVGLLTASSSLAQINLSLSRRANDGTVYQIIAVPPGPNLVGAEAVRVTTVAASINGLISCSQVGAVDGSPVSAVSGANGSIPQQQQPVSLIRRSAALALDDFSQVTFDPRTSGRLTLGSGRMAMDICLDPLNCCGGAEDAALVLPQDHGVAILNACLGFTQDDLTCLGPNVSLGHLGFGLGMDASFNCMNPATVRSTLCGATPDDGFTLRAGEVIAFVYFGPGLEASEMTLGASGFAIDLDGSNFAGCTSNTIVGADARTSFFSAPLPPTRTPTGTPFLPSPSPTPAPSCAATPEAEPTPTEAVSDCVPGGRALPQLRTESFRSATGATYHTVSLARDVPSSAAGVQITSLAISADPVRSFSEPLRTGDCTVSALAGVLKGGSLAPYGDIRRTELLRGLASFSTTPPSFDPSGDGTLRLYLDDAAAFQALLTWNGGFGGATGDACPTGRDVFPALYRLAMRNTETCPGGPNASIGIPPATIARNLARYQRGAPVLFAETLVFPGGIGPDPRLAVPSAGSTCELTGVACDPLSSDNICFGRVCLAGGEAEGQTVTLDDVVGSRFGSVALQPNGEAFDGFFLAPGEAVVFATAPGLANPPTNIRAAGFALGDQARVIGAVGSN